LGNPWIFKETARLFQGDSHFVGPDLTERISVMKEHLSKVIHYYGEQRGLASFHKFFIWYTRGLSGMRPYRDRAFRTDTLEELMVVIEDLNQAGKATG
jgi:tRNA-dihydrouridine synthase B